MKKIFALILFAALAFEAGAQTYQDALDFAGTDYLGTARSVGMGNAMTAVGGDLGSLTFNPAGSAVAAYSQFTITPGLSVSSVFGQGTYMDGAAYGFEDAVKTRFPRFQMPNIGAVAAYDTRNSSGLKRVTFGLVGNMTRNYNTSFGASGTNRETTLAGSLASGAEGWSMDDLGQGSWYGDIPWEVMTGYRGGIFDPIQDGSYYGITERLVDSGVQLADAIGQRYNRERTGSKYDLLMNLGLNFSDRVYVGGNIGVSTINMQVDESRVENALAGASYPTGFQTLRSRTLVTDTASGIYAQFGVIVRPTAGLRIGASLKTPTVYDFKENYRVEGYSVATGRSRNTMSSSADDEFFYGLRTPMVIDAGVAYTFGKVALLSVDYEFGDYSTTRFRSDRMDYVDFGPENDDLKYYACASHALRVGGELRPAPQMAIRVGYNYTSSPEVDVKASTQSVSFGLGYSSNGSFFLDAAVRFQYLPNELVVPYYYYDGDNIDYSILTPEICFQSSVCNALLTLGWRF